MGSYIVLKLYHVIDNDNVYNEQYPIRPEIFCDKIHSWNILDIFKKEIN